MSHPPPEIESERSHFDALATERRNCGFVPDLRRMGDNDYFYLSPYRRQKLAQLSLTRISRFATDNLQPRVPIGARVLDLGCGNGWFALELARAGFNVVAVDLSPDNIVSARLALKDADLSPGNGSVLYFDGDLNTWQPPGRDYDAACFNGSLHHLPDFRNVLSRALGWLKPDGYVMAGEPLPENNGEAEAAIAMALRLALSNSGAWHEKLPCPKDRATFDTMLTEVREEYRNWADRREQASQSPANNSSDGAMILPCLRNACEQMALEPLLALQHRLIDGLRFPSEELNVEFAQVWIWIEELLNRLGVIKPGGFLFFGKIQLHFKPAISDTINPTLVEG